MKYAMIIRCTALATGILAPFNSAAQDVATEQSAAVDAAPGEGDTSARQVFTPADFAQFAPISAADMLRRIPGFDIRGGGDGSRGLGQADFNVLINGQRLTGKSDSPRDQLSRISADDVVRIEILDGAALDIPGLSGQVANVTVDVQGLSGQFEWNGEYRPEIDTFYANRFDTSLTGATGDFTFSAAVQNRGFRRGVNGVIDVVDAFGEPIERQAFRSRDRGAGPRINAAVAWKPPSDLVVNLNGSYSQFSSEDDGSEDASQATGIRRLQSSLSANDRYDYELGGDVAFDLLGGRLKLIGLERFESGDFLQTVTTATFDGVADTGGQFSSLSDSGERIGRGEFSWSAGSADWQISAEAAFNRLERVAGLFTLQPDGTFIESDFADNANGVTEDRYEGSVSYSRPLASNLSLQLIAGGEFSRLEQDGDTARSREFLRPKGSASVGWQPASDIDISFKVARTVGQLSFGNFLARVFLANDDANAGNADLVPPQSWETELEVRKTLGPWGSATARLFDRQIEDLVEIIPVPGGQSPGNIPSASRRGVDLDATLELSQIGWNGARLDMSVELEMTSLADPLTGENRSFSGREFRQLFLNLRHDVPKTNWAYGGTLFHSRNTDQVRLTEIASNNEGPVFAELFVENKDVFGMTARLEAANLLNAKTEFRRTVFDGFRDTNPILFAERGDLEFGRIFRVSLEGSF